MSSLLTIENDAKTVKGSKRGWLTGILYLAPASESGVMNVCTSSTAGCRALCLYNAGRAMAFPTIKQARIRKTRWLHEDRDGFMRALRGDIVRLKRMARERGMRPCVRVNGTSDLPWLALAMAMSFPDVQFYDYTKHARPWTRTRANYALTFSYSGENERECLEALEHGVNVAVPFEVARGGELPKRWMGRRVIDGDLSDLRFRDRAGVVVGLRAKQTGKPIAAGKGFVVTVQELLAA